MIPTAEELFKKEYGTKDITEITLNGAVIIKDMINFAKLHVTAALKVADKAAKNNIIHYTDWKVKNNIITNAYSLNNIK